MEFIEKIANDDDLWEQIRERAKYDVVIAHGMHLLGLGELNRETVVMAMVLALSDTLQTVREAYIKHLSMYAEAPMLLNEERQP